MHRANAYALMGLMLLAAVTADDSAPTGPESTDAGNPWKCPDVGSAIMSCSALGSLNQGQLEQNYPLIVPPSTPGFSVRVLADVENGHVSMNLCPPNATTNDQCVPALTLLESPATQRLASYMAPNTLDSVPGTWNLKISLMYGLPQFALELSVTTAPVLLTDTDRTAVNDIYQACCPTSDENTPCGMLKTALTTSPSTSTTDLCHQPYMRCSADGHLEDFLLPNIYGDATAPALSCSSFPAAFGALPALKRLDLAGNDLSKVDIAEVTNTLGQSSTLRWLLLRFTGMTGTLGCDILAPSLNVLALTGNNLQGEVQPCFVNSPTLTHVYAGENALTGTVPELGTNAQLYFLSLYSQANAGLTGVLPDLSGATALRYVQLGGNTFSGPIPALPPNLRLLNVSYNQLTGALSDLPVSTTVFEAAGNNLSGPLPALDGLETMLRLNLDSNGFTGPVPATFPPLMRELALRNNLLTGPFPPVPPTLRYLDIAGNFFLGPCPDVQPGSVLEWYDISDNSFVAGLPENLPSQPSLQYLNASANQLTSYGSAEAWNVTTESTQLQTLDLSSNSIEGPLYGYLAVPYLSYLNMSLNMLGGSLQDFADTIPSDNAWIGSVFDVSFNQLTGDLPETLANLVVFSDVQTGYATATGMSTQRGFNVSFNNMTGPVPEFLTQALPMAIAESCTATPAADAVPCDTDVRIWGGNTFTCPDKGAGSNLTDAALSALQRMNLGCSQPDGSEVELASLLAGKPVSYIAPGWVVADEGAPDGNALYGGHPRRTRGPKLPPGAIAGIVIGSVLGAALIAGSMIAAALLVRRRRGAVRMPDVMGKPDINGTGAVTGALESTVGPLAATTPGAVCVSAPVNAPAGSYAPSRGPPGMQYLAGDNIV